MLVMLGDVVLLGDEVSTDAMIRFASDDGTEIVVHDLGGSGPPLMICHATGFHGRAYRPLLPILSTNFQVWAIDYRGHGQSQVLTGTRFGWADLARDLLGAIDHLGIGPVHAFGHSMGATTVLLAEEHRPGTFERAWLFEPIVLPPGTDVRNSMMAAGALKRRAEFASRAEALARYARRPPLGLLRADALSAYVEHGFIDNDDGTVRLACPPEHESQTFHGAVVAPIDLPTITPQIMVARGGVAAESSAADFAAPTVDGLPNATLGTYDDLTHFGPLESPDRIATDMVDFLTATD